jgi:hypothetical protein
MDQKEFVRKALTGKFLKVGEEFIPFKLFVGAFIPNAILRCKELSSMAKLVWARLCEFAGEKGECYPSQETLANELGTNKRSIIRSLQELEDHGFIKRVKPTGQDKLNHKTNRYKFLWHECFERTDESIFRSDKNDTPESKDVGDSELGSYLKGSGTLKGYSNGYADEDDSASPPFSERRCLDDMDGQSVDLTDIWLEIRRQMNGLNDEKDMDPTFVERTFRRLLKTRYYDELVSDLEWIEKNEFWHKFHIWALESVLDTISDQIVAEGERHE